MPSAETLTKGLPAGLLAAKPDTITCATPELFVLADATFNPSTNGSVAANETYTSDIGTPEKLLTVAVNVEVAPPITSEVLPELVSAMLAPITVTGVAAGAAVHPAQEAVTVAIRFVWSDDAAVMVTIAPVAVVTTDGALRITPLVAAKSIVAPATEALPLVSA